MHPEAFSNGVESTLVDFWFAGRVFFRFCYGQNSKNETQKILENLKKSTSNSSIYPIFGLDVEPNHIFNQVRKYFRNIWLICVNLLLKRREIILSMEKMIGVKKKINLKY
jgi:hypothetical protein